MADGKPVKTVIFAIQFDATNGVEIHPLQVFMFSMKKSIFKGERGKGERGKGSGVWPSMVTHTRNLSSAFNPSKCTLTAVNTHPELDDSGA